jgi:hypothetical protein
MTKNCDFVSEVLKTSGLGEKNSPKRAKIVVVAQWNKFKTNWLFSYVKKIFLPHFFFPSIDQYCFSHFVLSPIVTKYQTLVSKFCS